MALGTVEQTQGGDPTVKKAAADAAPVVMSHETLLIKAAVSLGLPHDIPGMMPSGLPSGLPSGSPSPSTTG